MTVGGPESYVGPIPGTQYAIEGLIYEGEDTWVFRGRYKSRHKVAIKMNRSPRPTATARFAREIEVLRALPKDPFVAGYIDTGNMPDSTPYLVLEHVEGLTLRDAMSSRAELEPRQAATLVAELCEAFRGLHYLGIVHRDLAPSNIILEPDGGIKITDFGLIRDTDGVLNLLEEVDIVNTKAFREEFGLCLTVGSPGYMSPEQIADASVVGARLRDVDIESDVFSLGVILLELISSENPFTMKSVTKDEYFKEVLHYRSWRCDPDEQPPFPGDDPTMAGILARALHIDPRKRYPDAQALMEALHAYLRDEQGELVMVDVPDDFSLEGSEERLALESPWTVFSLGRSHQAKRPPRPEPGADGEDDWSATDRVEVGEHIDAETRARVMSERGLDLSETSKEVSAVVRRDAAPEDSSVVVLPPPVSIDASGAGESALASPRTRKVDLKASTREIELDKLVSGEVREAYRKGRKKRKS